MAASWSFVDCTQFMLSNSIELAWQQSQVVRINWERLWATTALVRISTHSSSSGLEFGNRIRIGQYQYDSGIMLDSDRFCIGSMQNSHIFNSESREISCSPHLKTCREVGTGIRSIMYCSFPRSFVSLHSGSRWDEQVSCHGQDAANYSSHFPITHGFPFAYSYRCSNSWSGAHRLRNPSSAGLQTRFPQGVWLRYRGSLRLLVLCQLSHNQVSRCSSNPTGKINVL